MLFAQICEWNMCLRLFSIDPHWSSGWNKVDPQGRMVFSRIDLFLLEDWSRGDLFWFHVIKLNFLSILNRKKTARISKQSPECSDYPLIHIE